MPYTLKTQQIAVKDPDTGVYSGVDILAEQTTEGLLTEITATGEAVKADVSAQMATERSDFNTYVTTKEAELDQYKSTTETNINTYVTNKNQEITTMIAEADEDVSDLEDRKQDVATAVSGMLSKGVDNSLTTANVPAESKATGDLFETIVEGKATQPTDKWNRLWIKPSANDYEIPTMEDHNELSRQTSDLKTAITQKIENLEDAAFVEKKIENADIASFTDGANNISLGNLVVDITSESSGFTSASIYRTGKNLANQKSVLVNSSASWDSTLGAVKFTAMVDRGASEAIVCRIKKQGQYTISYDIRHDGNSTGDREIVVAVYTDGTTERSIVGSSEVGTWRHVSFTTNANKTVDYISYTYLYGIAGYPSYIKNLQVETGTSETTYEEFQGESYVINWNEVAGAITDGTLSNDGSSNWTLTNNSNSTEYSITAPPVSTIDGVNNIWANTGSIEELVYRSKPLTQEQIDNSVENLAFNLTSSDFKTGLYTASGQLTSTENKRISCNVNVEAGDTLIVTKCNQWMFGIISDGSAYVESFEVKKAPFTYTCKSSGMFAISACNARLYDDCTAIVPSDLVGDILLVRKQISNAVIDNDTVQNAKKNNLIDVDHRGYTTEAPENTIPAFAQAYIHGFEWVETDVRLTSDNVPVLLHDTTIDRTSNGTGAIAEMTLAEAREFDFSKGYNNYLNIKIPTLEEFLIFCKRTGLKAMLELKSEVTWTQEAISDIVDMVIKYSMLDKVTFNSFTSTVLEYVKTAESKATLCYVSNTLNATAVAIAKTLLNDENVVYLSCDNYSINNNYALYDGSGLKAVSWTITANDAVTLATIQPILDFVITNDIKVSDTIAAQAISPYIYQTVT